MIRTAVAALVGALAALAVEEARRARAPRRHLDVRGSVPLPGVPAYPHLDSPDRGR